MACSRSFAIVGLIGLLLPACQFAHRVMIPRYPSSEDMVLEENCEAIPVAIGDFEVASLKEWDIYRVGMLSDMFLTYVTAHCGFKGAKGGPPGNGLWLNARIETKIKSRRTWLLDALAVFPGLIVYQPFTPEWGSVTVRMKVGAIDPIGREIYSSFTEVEAPYDILFWSWFLRRNIEDAFRRAYHETFRAQARALAAKHGEFLEALKAPYAEPVAAGTGWRQIYGIVKATGMAAPEERRISLEQDGTVYLIQKEEKDDPRRAAWRNYVGALGGVRLTTFKGLAGVSSSIRDEDGSGSRVVASGNARSSGYRISLYSTPKKTGLFIYPTVDFMDQTIDIADFRERVPVVQRPDTTDMQGLFSDPDSGVEIDITEPNTYRLNLRSTAVGQRAGFDLVLRLGPVRSFLTAEGGANVLERRWADVRLAQHREIGSQWIWLGSGAVAGRLGFGVPKIHLSVSGTAEWRYYPKFDYPNPIEFRAPVKYNPAKDIFERPRSFVGAASLDTTDFTLSVSYVF
ncbi:MAG: hypothetical protein HYT87_16560 [Nitrospirae bacterium]|nr:hypothetical protein [Nitrospirota bacterium]